MGREIEQPTFTSKQYGEIPKFSHVKGFKDLALVAGSIAVETYGRVFLIVILVRKSYAGSDWDLSANYAVTTIETLGEHVHRSTFSIRNAFSPAKELSNN